VYTPLLTSSGLEIDNFMEGKENDKMLVDRLDDNKTEAKQVLFAKGFDDRITDIKTGPDGYLYILTYLDGRIYKISP
jgi:glucose/arabinose dehydrogenase